MDKPLFESLMDAFSPTPTALDSFITQDTEMLQLKEKVRRLALKNINVLILGETGTGKESIARALHDGRNGDFIAVNTAGTPDSLLESEFFGAVKGAYTGCQQTRKGYFELATNGTIFLDEVSELPLILQSKFLRVLQDKTVKKLGAETGEKFNFRVVSASNISSLHQYKKFRKDLYYRLSSVILKTKPLRERPDDIPLIVSFFDEKKQIPLSLVNDWKKEEWPGNVRELKNRVEEFLIFI